MFNTPSPIKTIAAISSHCAFINPPPKLRHTSPSCQKPGNLRTFFHDRRARMATIGKRNTLKIIREAPPGLYLDGGELGEILLPGKFIPRDLKPKDLLNVFIYLDSEDRLVATTETPLAEVGEFAALKVVGVNRNVGAFLNWGLAKDLLLP